MSTPVTELIERRAYIGGEWVDADSGATFAVTNPATGEIVAEVPRMGAAETRRAIDGRAARAAGLEGRCWPRTARGIMRRWADLMLEHAEQLAVLLTTEQGKPLAESRVEVAYAASFLEWFGEEAKRVYGDTIPTYLPDRRIVVTKEAVGVTAGITPWNFPAAMPTRKAAPALGAGCTMVLKPAEQTPLTALAVMRLGEEAGLPPGVLSIVTGDADDAPEIGGEMTSNPVVRKLGFTGSTEVGKLLMAQCAGQVKKVSLELGGNAPFIVFDDADLDAAIAGALTCKYRNSGQTCISANRILVQDAVYDEFVARFTEGVRDARRRRRPGRARRRRPADRRAGHREGRAPRRRRARRTAPSCCSAAERHERGGAVLHAVGADRHHRRDGDQQRGDVRPRRGHQPLRRPRRRRCARPTTRPTACRATSTAATWRACGACPRRWSTASSASTPASSRPRSRPFGGVKESGIGREGSKYGIDEWLETKYLCMGGM